MDSNNHNTALLVMDMQLAVIRSLPDYNEIAGKVAEAIAYARSQNIPVLFVVVGFRPGMPEVSMNNKVFSASKERSANKSIGDLMNIDDTVAPIPGEIIITKRRLSAFTGSDLEVVLRAQGIQDLVLTGVATSGVVLSTLREAADKDYRITVLSDCCTDRDIEVHNVLTNKVFPFQASVLTLEEWCNK
ncbi:Nicotinamidase-related amidase [Chitinophaga sp. CF118]|uniref:cysteine hydrolase family protein n=1 Tax=Chitinophaga sp. CF118 TaxID=1884367 RepID=UPI0008EE0504|nr:isochorismatase family cysteine hydrolase [Chitinophaga sp. CF118]SFD22403.1 Nicotinamidase-related amidase [Chitinophaga sp. CF118]